MRGNTVVTAVPLALEENGSKIAYLSHRAGTARGAPPIDIVALWFKARPMSSDHKPVDSAHGDVTVTALMVRSLSTHSTSTHSTEARAVLCT